MSRNWMLVLASLLFSFLAGSARADSVLFQDNFSGATLSAQWKIVQGTARVQDGELYTHGDGRDSGVVTHDGDATWTNYRVSATINPLQGMPSLLFRTNGTSDFGGYGLHMDGYRLQLNPGIAGYAEDMGLAHIVGDNVQQSVLAVVHPGVLNGPNHVEVLLEGARIQVWLNSIRVIDVIDPNPVLSGGIGIQSIWALPSGMDDVVVTATTAVPLPASWAMGLVGLLALTARARRRAEARS